MSKRTKSLQVRPLLAAAVAAGLDLGGVVLPAVIEALAVGPAAAEAGGDDMDSGGGARAAAEARARWRRQRTRLALELSALLRGVADPAQVGWSWPRALAGHLHKL